MLDFCVDTNCESVEFTLVDTIPGKTDQLLLSEDERSWLFDQCEKVWSEARGNRYKDKVLLFGFERFMRQQHRILILEEHDKNTVNSFPFSIGHIFAQLCPTEM